MKNKHTPSLPALLLMLILTIGPACTRNNGDIGDWFGTWRVDELTIDGEPDPDYTTPRMIWKFQNSIIQIMWPDDSTHSAPWAVGSWHEDDGRLYLNFDWGLNSPPSFTHLDKTSTLNILKLSRSTIELEYKADSGNTYYYKLKKWG